MTALVSNDGVAIIERLRFDPQAEMRCSILPLGSIYWTDELPPLMFLAFRQEGDRKFAMRLFAIRINFWNKGEIDPEELTFWNEAKAQFPNWPIFERLNVTDEIKREHEHVQEETEKFFTEFAEDADEFEISKDGDFWDFSATFDLTKDD